MSGRFLPLELDCRVDVGLVALAEFYYIPLCGCVPVSTIYVHPPHSHLEENYRYEWVFI